MLLFSRILFCCLLGFCLMQKQSVTAQQTESEISNLAINGSFETEGGWKLLPRKGAKGSIAKVTPGYEGESALQISVTETDGYLVLRSERPIRVKAGVTYTFRGWFRAENAPIGALLLFRVGGITSSLRYDSIDRSAGWSSQSLVINTPPGRWEKRVITFKSSHEQDVYLNLVLMGATFDVQVDNLEFYAGETPVITAEKKEYAFPFSKEQVLEHLESRQPVTAELVQKHAITRLQVNGEVTAPVLYKGLESSKDRGDYKGFGNAKIPLMVTALRLGPSSTYPDTVWEGAGKYNLEQVDATLLAVLQKDPDAKIILDIWMYPYPEWGDENPSEVMRKPNGKVVLTTAFNQQGTAPADATTFFDPKSKLHAYPSIYSEKWQSDIADVLKAITEHLKTSPYGKSVAGFFVTSGQDGQFIYTGTDNSEPSRNAFHQWLTKKYQTISALNSSLGTTYRTFQEIELPDYDKPPAEETKNPSIYTSGLHPLYGEFKEESTWAFRDEVAGILKTGMERPVLALTYGTPPTQYFYTSKHLDGAGTMTYYPFRNPGHAIGFNPGNGAPRHGKLIFQEIDLRSWVGSQYKEVYQRWIGAGDTPERWKAINLHLAGISLANHFGFWYYDMGNYYQAPEIMTEIADTINRSQKFYQKEPSEFQPGVVMVTTDVGDSHQGNRHQSSVYSNIASIHLMILAAHGWTLNTSGVPYHVHSLIDILNDPELQKYKIYIFYQSPYLSKEEREGIRKYLATGGRTIIWMHDTGYLTENGPSIEAQSKLVGMQLTVSPEPMRSTLKISEEPHPFIRGVRPFQNLSDTLASIFSLHGAGEYGFTYHLFSVIDPEATVLGYYPESNETGFAVKKMDDWTSIFFGVPNAMQNDLLHRIAQETGVFVAGPPGDSVVMNGDFVSIHALSSRTYPFTLPEGKRTLKNALTGEILSQGKPVVELLLKAQHTYWYLIEE